MKSAKWRVIGAASVICLGVMVSAATAKIVSKNYSGYFMIGVDSNGNPSSSLGAFGPAKIFKDTKTGVVVGVFGAKVTNLSGKAQVYFDLGSNIQDPETDGILRADHDVAGVTATKGQGKAIGAAVSVATSRGPA